MEFARRETELESTDDKGVSYRKHLIERKRKGLPHDDLYNPMPDDLSYLYDHATRLVGRSGVGMAGFAPLSPSVVRDYLHLSDITLEPHEVDALYALDSVMRVVPKGEEEVKQDEPVEIAPWPKKKPDA